MPRIGRIILPHYPHHVVQRGHNRQVVFAEPGDDERYLKTLMQFKEIYGVKVYAYCLMTSHVHLLVVPEEIAGLGQLMKRLAGRQTPATITAWKAVTAPCGKVGPNEPSGYRRLPVGLRSLYGVRGHGSCHDIKIYI